MAKTSFARPGAAKAAPAPATTAKEAAPEKPAPTKKAPPPAGIRTNATPSAPPPKKAVAKPAPVREVEAEVLPPAEPDEIVETQVAAPQRQLSTKLAPPRMLGQPRGEIDASDFDLPFLKLKQGDSGPLHEAGFEDGQWVLDADTTIWQEGWEPLEITVLDFNKLFMQQLDYDGAGGEMPQIFKTSDDAQKAGLVPFGGHEVGYVSFAQVTVLIQEPPYELVNINGDACNLFLEEFDGKLFSVGMWRITGTAYKFGAKKILRQLRTRLRGGFHTGSIKLEARQEKGKLKTYWAPQIRDGVLHSGDMLEWCAQMASQYDSGAIIESEE